MTTAAVALLLQSITWLYANDLSAGAAFQRDRCRVFRATNVSVVSVGSVGFVGVCNTRAAPVCDGSSNGSSRGGTQAVTFTLVLGGRAATVGHLRVGAGVRMAGASVATKDVPDGATVGGYPAWDIKKETRVIARMRRLIRD